jgi:hypothetical protein
MSHRKFLVDAIPAHLPEWVAVTKLESSPGWYAISIWVGHGWIYWQMKKGRSLQTILIAEGFGTPYEITDQRKVKKDAKLHC